MPNEYGAQLMLAPEGFVACMVLELIQIPQRRLEIEFFLESA